MKKPTLLFIYAANTNYHNLVPETLRLVFNPSSPVVMFSQSSATKTRALRTPSDCGGLVVQDKSATTRESWNAYDDYLRAKVDIESLFTLRLMALRCEDVPVGKPAEQQGALPHEEEQYAGDGGQDLGVVG
ncbi:hypothetical protein S40288_10859 [Stachybotrys chartarum IBT 40288]|nr:hypothetical protein S40288_10859 [Stachybotrys chartarum IBT 40288]